jgi:murein DD-endopeptidase MepM/ murein hydrolase activator NlpD
MRKDNVTLATPACTVSPDICTFNATFVRIVTSRHARHPVRTTTLSNRAQRFPWRISLSTTLSVSLDCSRYLFVTCRKDPLSVPSHRAPEKPRGPREASPSAGRRRATTIRRRRVAFSSVSAVAGVALLVTGVGAAAANHLIPTAGHSSTTTAGGAPSSTISHVGDRTGSSQDRVSRSMTRPQLDTSSTSPSRTDVSRSGSRKQPDNPAPEGSPQTAAVVAAASRAAALRDQSLESADTSAQNYAKTLQSDEWVLPTSGFHISVWFGEAGPYWSSGYHTGIDFATAYGTPVVAVQNATVFQTGWDGAYGNQIRLQFTNGDQVWYNHLSSIEVSKGDTVVKGQEIGKVGETGNAYGAHLHFEYRLAKDLSTGVDPKPFFEAHGISLS